MTDELKKFVFDAAPVRGELVRLEGTWQEVLGRRRYPAPVSTLLGEMMAAAALLSANLKFNGALVMQLHGDGPVHMLVVECNSDLSMRATAKIADGAEIADDATLAAMVNVHGNGRFAITLDPQDKLPGQQPYQGIVPLSDENGPLASITEVLEHYMQSSEQLDTRLWLAADNKVASGMLLQRLPSYGGAMEGRTGHAPAQVGETGQPLHQYVQEQDLDTWERVCQLGKTLRRDELLEQPIDTLIKRLYWEEMEAAGIRMFEPQSPRFRCSCSRLRVGSMLRTLGQPEVDSILEERGKVEIDCEFCGQHYSFDAVDCAQLFAQETVAQGIQSASDQRH
ncbi:33 kDa chaperonin [Ralstonia edaphis]|uniref:Hsp33 family molecular chaperone HslO n=1 Tax=Ralstonia edaphi TaxID=3058599 RepID=UPI0028F692AB|nr:Hsp33 family molecular chaperone HslO [Ralstonia sp. LMG 6871]CAJ0719772.1 33 kDa chaperonin [Ralstonia sp. LMG 6871]